MNFGAALKDKLGPFPTWLWLLLITIAGLGWWLIESRKSSSSSTAADATGGQADVPEIVIQNQEPGAQSPSGTSPPTGPGPVISVPPTGKAPTGGGGGAAHYKFITTGKAQVDEDVQEIANSYGMTEAQLVKLNPDLKKYVGSGKSVPSGIRIKVRANLPPIKGPHGPPGKKPKKPGKVNPGGTNVPPTGDRLEPGGPMAEQAA